MRKFITILFITVAIPSMSQVLLWSEDFEGEANGATSGTAAGTIGGPWTSTYVGAGTFSKQNPLGINSFQVTNTNGEGVWNMTPVSIAGTGRAIIEVTVVGFFVGAGDYFRAFYRVDGGPEVMFFEQTGAIVSFTLTGSAIVTGSTLEVVIRATTNGDFFGIDSFTFDDINITGVNTLYSRKSGNWNDATVGNGTWSLIGLGGASCDCTPIATDYVIVGNSNTVDINVAATAGGVEVRNTGTLRYSVNTVDLNIDRGILQVDVGGTISRNGHTAVQIDFDRGITSTFINNGTITAENMRVTLAAAHVNITGSGSIALTGDFSILDDDIIVDNDLNGTFTIGDELIFNQASDFASDDAEFINRRTLTITTRIFVEANNDDGNIFTNAAGATVTVGGIDLTDSNGSILNSGTINQSGDLLNIVNGAVIQNLATGIWNWSFVQAAFDANLVNAMNCSAVGNLFNYSAAGGQSIINIIYHHLTLSGSGIKPSSANLDVNGNLLIAGTARLDQDTGNDNLNLAGNWTVTSTDPDPFDGDLQTVTLDGTANSQTISTVLAGGETFDNLITNNTFAAAPQFTLNSNVTVLTVLTMTSGRINLNGKLFTITSNAAGSLVHGLTSASGWMYGGSVVRGTTNGVIAVGNVRGLFPLGSATDFRPIYFGKPAGTTTATTTALNNSSLTTTSTVSFADDLTITRRHDSFWTITTTCTGGANTWALRAGGTGFGTIANILHLRLSTSVGITGSPGTNSGTTANPLIERTAISIANLNANNFHVASVDAVNSPLPIGLISFTGQLDGGRARLDWVTESELNNDYFTLERTADAERFEPVAQVKGNGTTTLRSTYRHYDDYPLPGTSYYRLKQTDFDGMVSYSELIKIVADIRKTELIAFPNPATNKQTTLDVVGLSPAEEIMIVILDMHGARIYAANYVANANGSVRARLDLSMASTGMFVVRMYSSSCLTQTKLVVE